MRDIFKKRGKSVKPLGNYSNIIQELLISRECFQWHNKNYVSYKIYNFNKFSISNYQRSIIFICNFTRIRCNKRAKIKILICLIRRIF